MARCSVKQACTAKVPKQFLPMDLKGSKEFVLDTILSRWRDVLESKSARPKKATGLGRPTNCKQKARMMGSERFQIGSVLDGTMLLKASLHG